jgi:hypothetical protein
MIEVPGGIPRAKEVSGKHDGERADPLNGRQLLFVPPDFAGVKVHLVRFQLFWISKIEGLDDF